VIVAMFETPTPPRERGPSREWTTTYVMSISGILKIAEMVENVQSIVAAFVVRDLFAFFVIS